jgi:hypothetical protein
MPMTVVSGLGWRFLESLSHDDFGNLALPLSGLTLRWRPCVVDGGVLTGACECGFAARGMPEGTVSAA